MSAPRARHGLHGDASGVPPVHWRTARVGADSSTASGECASVQRAGPAELHACLPASRYLTMAASLTSIHKALVSQPATTRMSSAPMFNGIRRIGGNYRLRRWAHSSCRAWPTQPRLGVAYHLEPRVPLASRPAASTRPLAIQFSPRLGCAGSRHRRILGLLRRFLHFRHLHRPLRDRIPFLPQPGEEPPNAPPSRRPSTAQGGQPTHPSRNPT